MADLDALEHLELAGPMSQRELGERLLLSSGAVTFLVDRLERAGTVRRQPHPTDRRTTLIALVAETELPEVPELDAYHAATRRAASELPAAGREAVISFLSSVTVHAAAATGHLRRRPRV